jgi:twinkle protein
MTLSADMMERLEARGLDIELADRLELASVRRDGGEALVIPFRRDGQVVRRKYRFFDRDEGKWSADKGGQRIAFNEDCLRDDTLLDQPLIVTEGELDAIAALQAGFGRTISVPDGAPPPGERSKDDLEASAKYEWLADIRPLLTRERVPAVILAADGDENGAALLQDLSVLLGRFRCKFLTYPKSRKDRGRERCKDLNEVLEDWGSKGVVETISRAQWIRVDGVYRMGELPPLPPNVIYEPRHQLFAENFKCRLGDFSVVTGTPGFGKSTFVNDLFCGIAQDNHLTVAWASFEQEPQRDHRRSLRSWFTGRREIDLLPNERDQADRWIEAQHLFLMPREDEDATLEWLFEKMEIAVTRYAARIIVIDPWNELEHDRRQGESETEYIGRAIRALKRFAKAFHVHICVVAHPTKSAKDADGNYRMPTLYDINGSANWYNKSDLGVIVHREDELNTVIKVQKSRYHELIGRPGEVRCHFSKDERRFIEVERVT